MQRIWSAENKEEKPVEKQIKLSINTTAENTPNMWGSKREWVFRVHVSDIEKNECVYVVGNLNELGNWNHNQAIQLFQESYSQDSDVVESNGSNSNSDSVCYSEDIHTGGDRIHNVEDKGRTFAQKVALPLDADIEYRYFVAVICYSNGTKNSAKTLIIRRWETHIKCRHIKKNMPSNIVNDSLPDAEIFGCIDGFNKIERGWLTDETVIQFKIFNNPMKIWKHRLQNRKVNIKMTPVNLVRHSSLELQFASDFIDDSLSMDTQDVVEQQANSITEIAVMNDEESHFKYQEQFGRTYNEDDFLNFNVAVRNPETTAYLVDYYVYGSRAFPGEPPVHIGFSYILPSILQTSVGMLTVPMTSTKHRPIGQLTVEYVVIKPIPDHPWEMSISFTKHWDRNWSGLDVGHRGLGTSFKFETKHCANVRENTLASLKSAAYYGADMVEFDVQLSKDHVPVVYHDFFVSISLRRKKEIEVMDTLEIPVKELTLEQLHLLKIYHVAEGRDKNPRYLDEHLEDHQPFPTLQSVLLELDLHVACNIEIKWTMQFKDGTYELNHPFDLNMYLDTILKVILEYGGERKIVFSSFHPDICVMIRLKQNKYPVIFLTQGETSRYPTYHDPRCQSIPMAVRHALAADILGINIHTEEILRDPSKVNLIKNAGLIIFCWGDDNNDKDTIRHLKNLGLHAVIYDKIDEYNPKGEKERMFLVAAKETQKELIAVAQSAQGSNITQIPMPGPINIDYNAEREYLRDLEMAQNLLSTSTATSHSSLDKTAAENSVPKKVPTCEDLESKEISEITKDFSVCAKSFGHQVKTRNISDIVYSQAAALPAIYVEDESAKDCL